MRGKPYSIYPPCSLMKAYLTLPCQFLCCYCYYNGGLLLGLWKILDTLQINGLSHLLRYFTSSLQIQTNGLNHSLKINYRYIWIYMPSCIIIAYTTLLHTAYNVLHTCMSYDYSNANRSFTLHTFQVLGHAAGYLFNATFIQ